MKVSVTILPRKKSNHFKYIVCINELDKDGDIVKQSVMLRTTNLANANRSALLVPKSKSITWANGKVTQL